ncbi:uncharacterized protein LOC116107812 [Pistacia vera]|uniref:uncharacterized protein LOC116107812 n=1 Tax=Pistacia vera TaxID=55513 RepID=UPI0012630149|nr:uncharacterized protein LOC116107812 [Pistacia vera]
MRRGTESPGNGYKSFFNLQSNKDGRTSVSRSTSKHQDSREGEYATAVLAAAFAIQSVEESKTLQNKNGLQPHSNGVTRQPSYNNAKVPGETSMRKPKLQDRGALETLNPPRTPSRSSSDAREKNEKHEKLKSVVAWANEKKEKAKNKIEKTKSDLDLKFSKKPATSAKGGR